jgi:hypothetical protein
MSDDAVNFTWEEMKSTYVSPRNCGGCDGRFVKTAAADILDVLEARGIKVAPMKRCGRCKAAWYCSKACQTQAWKVHRQSCVAVATTRADGATHDVRAQVKQELLALNANDDGDEFYVDVAAREKRLFRQINGGERNYEAMAFPFLFMLGKVSAMFVFVCLLKQARARHCVSRLSFLILFPRRRERSTSPTTCIDSKFTARSSCARRAAFCERFHVRRLGEEHGKEAVRRRAA